LDELLNSTVKIIDASSPTIEKIVNSFFLAFNFDGMIHLHSSEIRSHILEYTEKTEKLPALSELSHLVGVLRHDWEVTEYVIGLLFDKIFNCIDLSVFSRIQNVCLRIGSLLFC
jgi:hypothetical protein